MSRWSGAHVAFLLVCVVCTAFLALTDRGSAATAVGAFAYGLILWLIARAFIKYDPVSENVAFRTTARGWRLALRVVVLLGALLYVVTGRHWFWNTPLNVGLQHISVAIGLGNGDTALPNVLFEAIVPGVLMFVLGAARIEFGLVAWRAGAWKALAGALVLPVIFCVLWFRHGHGTAGLLAVILAHNFLSNGLSEEFLTRGLLLSHLRAFLSKDWAVVTQAVLFGLLHVNPWAYVQSWPVEIAGDVAMNAPIGFFLALIALRARSILLPGLIHTTLDSMQNFIG
jgi:membrane protease YdiL (CAAX protease family)